MLPSGDIEFMNVVERVHMVNQIPDGRCDGVRQHAKTRLRRRDYEDAAKAVGVPLSTMRITPQGKVIAPPYEGSQSGRQRRCTDRACGCRKIRVAIGDTWDEPFEVKVKVEKTASKTIKTRWHHKLADVKNGIATIEVTYQVLSPIDAPIEMEFVQRMMKARCSSTSRRARIQSQKMDVDKRIIGFAGPTSSMQYIMKMEEKLITDDSKMAAACEAKSVRWRQENSVEFSEASRANCQPAKDAIERKNVPTLSYEADGSASPFASPSTSCTSRMS